MAKSRNCLADDQSSIPVNAVYGRGFSFSSEHQN